MLRIFTYSSVVTLLLLSCLQTVSAEDLALITDRSRASGELRVYIQNMGKTNHFVLTQNLSYMASEGQVEISPDRHSLVKDGKIYPLKESLTTYGVVLLKPGEITYIHRPIVDIKTGVLKYTIKESWAKMHDTWGGTIKANF